MYHVQLVTFSSAEPGNETSLPTIHVSDNVAITRQSTSYSRKQLSIEPHSGGVITPINLAVKPKNGSNSFSTMDLKNSVLCRCPIKLCQFSLLWYFLSV